MKTVYKRQKLKKKKKKKKKIIIISTMNFQFSDACKNKRQPYDKSPHDMQLAHNFIICKLLRKRGIKIPISISDTNLRTK